MNRGSGKCTAALWLALSLCLLGSGYCARLPAHAQARLRVLLLAPEGSAFAQRVRGQAGDLPLELVPSEAQVSDTLDPSSLLREQSADAALWLDERGPAVPEVHLVDALGKATQTRRAELAGSHTEDSSARSEIAALLARAELLELLESRRAPAQEPSKLPASPEGAPVAKPGSSPPEFASTQADAETSSTSQISPGWHGGFVAGLRIGQLDAARWLLSIEVGPQLRWRALGLGLFYAGSFEDQRDLSSVRLGLRTDRLALNVSGVFELLPTLEFSAGADLGVLLTKRTTDAVMGELERTPAHRSGSFVAAPRLSLRWSPRWYLSFGISLGVDFLTTSPTYEVVSAAGRTELERLRWAQPWVSFWLLGIQR
ncbi:MAG: hypothetical protein QM778_15300 [Myxococcales bacterium]